MQGEATPPKKGRKGKELKALPSTEERIGHTQLGQDALKLPAPLMEEVEMMEAVESLVRGQTITANKPLPSTLSSGLEPDCMPIISSTVKGWEMGGE